MIASPSDVPKERQLARSVISEWNTIHSKDRGIVLMPIGWETHSVPDTGDRAQAIINGQLLKDADLLVVMFWTRIGSPTGVAQSGTVEEIEEHLRAGKPAMIYFSTAPVRLDSIDNEQYAKLKEFKQSLGQRGLFHEYEDLTDFKDKFARHLAQKIISDFRRATSQANGDTDFAVPVPVTITHSQPVPALGDAASELLIEASKDSQGVVMNLQTLGGSFVQTNGRNFSESNPRSEAQWRGAVTELNNLGLLEDRTGKREIFYVTDQGYRVAELLQQQ